VFQLMNLKEFENLIGQDISYANQVLIDEGFEYHKPLEDPFYTSDSYVDFYGMPYNLISIITDDKNMINSITIHFNAIINKSFYDAFILDYGNPDTTQIIDGRDFVGKWTKTNVKDKGEIEHRVRRVTLKMREGKFEENPLFMIWNKKGYQIKTLSKHEQNMSTITFRIPTNEF